MTERDFPTNRGGLCQKGWTAAELLDSPDRLLYAPGSRQPLRAASAGNLGGGAGPDRRGHRTHAATSRQRWRRSFRRRQPHQRKGLPAGKVRASCAADFADRLQRPVLHVVGGGRIDQSIRPRSRSSVSAGGYRPERKPFFWSAAIWRRPCRPSCSISRSRRSAAVR